MRVTETELQKFVRETTEFSVVGGGTGGQVVGMGNRELQARNAELGISISVRLFRSQHKARAAILAVIELLAQEHL